MRRARAWRAAALIAGAAVLPWGRGAAQTGPPVFGEAIEVRVINVEAVVTDGAGRRVTGLGPDDFRLRLDGHDVPIEFFSEIRDGRILPAGAHRLPADLGLDDAARADGRAPTHYLIFIDDFFAIGAQRDLVLTRLAAQLDRLEPPDRAAVLAFDGKSLEVLSPWTSSRGELRRTLEAARRRKAGGVLRRVEKLMFASQVRDTARASDGFGGRIRDQAGAPVFPASMFDHRMAELRRQIDRLVHAAAAGMRGLAPPPGRRVMLLLSGGWPLAPEGLEGPLGAPRFTELDSVRGAVPELRFERGLGWYGPLTDAANHLGYTLYPVDVPGVGHAGPDVTADGPGGGFDVSERAQEEVLLFLAQATGGRAMLNGLRAEALERAAADTRSYYWLGFTAPRLRDDLRRRLQLEVLRPGLAARTRRGTVDLSTAAESKLLVEGGLLVAGEAPPAELGVDLGEPRTSGYRRIDLPISLQVPLSEITLLPLGDRLVADLEITLGVRDKRDVLSDVVTLPVRLTTSERELLEAPDDRRLSYGFDATLRHERHDLVVSVRDLVSGRILSAKVEVRP